MRRRLATRALVVTGSLLLVAGLVAATLNATVFSSDGFGDAVSRALEEPSVARAAGVRVGEAVVAAEPDLVGARPIIDGAATAVAGSRPFRALVRDAAADLHRSVFDRDAATVTLVVADAAVLVTDALRALAPAVARRVPEQVRVALVDFSAGVDDEAVAGALRAARATRIVAWLAFPLAVLAFAGAVLLERDRRREVLLVAGAVGVAGLIAAVLAFGGAALADARAPEPLGDAARDVWWSFAAPLRTWGLGLLAFAAIVAAAASSLVAPRPVFQLVREAAERAVAIPSRPLWRGLRGALIVAVGVVVLLEPLGALRVVALAAGLLLVYAGAAELLRLVALHGRRRAGVPQRREPARARGLDEKGRAAARVGAVAFVLMVVAAGASVVLAAQDDPPAPVATCNGHVELCDRPVTDVAFAATHNAMAVADEPGWLFAAQDLTIREQLDRGVRALLVDTHYGVRTARGVYTLLGAGTKSRDKIEAPLGAEFVATVERLRRRIGYRGGGEREVWLCHAFCEVGATRAVDALRTVRDFLVRRPGEVVLLSFEDGVTPADTEAVMREAGLLDEAWTGPVDGDGPTLRAMIDAGQRLLVMAEEQTGGRPWLKQQFDLVQETPYTFPTVRSLEAPASCDPGRGARDNPMLLLNHWVDTSPAPRPSNARVANGRDALLERARRCERERGRMPTLVAVDFAGVGDVMGVVDELNGVR